MGDWTKAGSLPQAMRGHASVIVGERLVVLGGHDDRGFFPDAISAPLGKSGEIGEWEALAPLPLPLVHSGIAAHNDSPRFQRDSLGLFALRPKR